MIDFILFDLGEVIVNGMAGVYEKIAVKTGRREEDVHEHLCGQKLFDFFEGRDPEVDYWARVSIAGRYEQDLEFFRTIMRENFTEMPGIVRVVAQLYEMGIPMGILSDIGKEWADDIEERHSFMNLFNTTCYSFECGHRKNVPEIFEFARKKCRFDPARTLFVDDRLRNVRVALSDDVRIGQAHLFAGVEGFINSLSGYGIEIN